MSIIREVTIGDCRLIQGDCAEVLPTLERVGLLLTDPPWIASKSKMRNGGGGVAQAIETHSGVAYGDIGAFDAEVVNLAISKAERAVVFTGTKEATQLNPKFWMFWHRPNPMPTPVLPFHQSVSPILLFGNWAGIHLGDQMLSIHKLNAGCIASPERVLEQKNGKAAHPCQMPVALPLHFLSQVDGDVLDPWLGSGTTGVACVKTGRKFIGIEKEPKYFEIACRRIEQAYADQGLFTGAIA